MYSVNDNPSPDHIQQMIEAGIDPKRGALFLGDVLIDSIPGKWELLAMEAKKRGDMDEVTRLLAESILDYETKLMSIYFPQEVTP